MRAWSAGQVTAPSRVGLADAGARSARSIHGAFGSVSDPRRRFLADLRTPSLLVWTHAYRGRRAPHSSVITSHCLPRKPDAHRSGQLLNPFTANLVAAAVTAVRMSGLRLLHRQRWWSGRSGMDIGRWTRGADTLSAEYVPGDTAPD